MEEVKPTGVAEVKPEPVEGHEAQTGSEPVEEVKPEPVEEVKPEPGRGEA